MQARKRASLVFLSWNGTVNALVNPMRRWRSSLKFQCCCHLYLSPSLVPNPWVVGYIPQETLLHCTVINCILMQCTTTLHCAALH